MIAKRKEEDLTMTGDHSPFSIDMVSQELVAGTNIAQDVELLGIAPTLCATAVYHEIGHIVRGTSALITELEWGSDVLAHWTRMSISSACATSCALLGHDTELIGKTPMPQEESRRKQVLIRYRGVRQTNRDSQR
jgi:hypothetical protein